MKAEFNFQETGRKRQRTDLVCAFGRSLRLCIVVLTACSFCRGAHAQYVINWSTIDGGGGISTGVVYSVGGTTGQTDAGPTMSGGKYAVTGGFWALPQATQAPRAPRLSITTTSPGVATISWAPEALGWVLQENPDPSTTNWMNAPTGTNNPVVVPATWPAKFYRLQKP